MSETRGDEGTTTDWEALARQASVDSPDSGDVVDLIQLLCFELDDAPYAAPVEEVREIVRLRPIAPIPRVPADVRGVISLRGEIIQVIDLRQRLGLRLAEPTRASRIIVAYGGDSGVAGLLVDNVKEVMRVSGDAIRPSSSDSGAVESLCVKGDRFVSLLDLERVLEIDAERRS